MSAAVKHMSMEKLIDEAEHAEPGVTAPYQELRVRVDQIRRFVDHTLPEVLRALDGEPLSFVQLLDRIMDEMDAAGVADAQAGGIQEQEDEPHRRQAFDYRAMLEERVEQLSDANQRILDGRS